MSLNPFTEFPLWNYFTLHTQNIPYVNDEIRLANIGDKPLPYNNTSNEMKRVISLSFFYDFMNDAIVRGDSLDSNKILIMTNSVFNKNVRTIPPDAIIIIKGVSSTLGDGMLVGGEFMPVIGIPKHMALLLKSLIAAQNLSKGITTDKNGNLIMKINVIESLNDPIEQARLNSLLNRSIYKSASIKAILNSYTKEVAIPADIEKGISKIRASLSKHIPEDKAINVSSGARVSITGARYNIFELQVMAPNTNNPIVVKFAFSTKMGEEERDMYMTILNDRFKAQKIEASEVAVDQRRTISLKAVQATQQDYNNLLNEEEGFHTYLQKLNEITQTQVIDTSQVLHEEIRPTYYEEEYEEEDIEDY